MRRASSGPNKENKSVLTRQNDPGRETFPSATQNWPVESLHRTMGNQAVQQFHENNVLQPKPTVNSPDGRYEREAERVAEEVMRMSDPKEEMQHMETSSEASTTNTESERQIQVLRGGGRPLPKSVRAFFEPRFGEDLSDVRIHTDTRAARAARSINARAFTAGRDIVFGTGEYSSNTTTGRRLLAHELAHVVQKNVPLEIIQRQQSAFGEAAHWYTPWVQDIVSSPNSTSTAINQEPNTVRSFDTDWVRDALSSALLTTLTGLTSIVLGKRLGLSRLFSAAGLGAAAYTTYKNVRVQERIWGQKVDYHEWYGKYRVDPFFNHPQAVDFQGKGPSETALVTPYFYQQRIMSNQGVVYLHPRHELRIPGMPLGPPQFPEYSFGTFE